ncbi:MAG: trypsin-like serine protease [Pseudomonadota bacterium]
MNSFRVGLVLLFSLMSWAQQVPRLVGGAPANEKFPAVFLFSEFREDFTDSFCTATKISPNQFLTAAHCVLETNEKSWFFPETAKPGNKYYYSFGRDLSKAVPIFAMEIKKIHIHPLLQNCINKGKYFPAQCHMKKLPNPDLAIVTVEPGVGPFFEAATLPFDFTPNKPGDEIIILGYGAQENGDTTPPVLKYGYSKIATPEELEKATEGTSAAEMGFLQYGFYFGSLGSLLNSAYPNLGSGDSGGPVLKEAPDRIVGVNSSAVCLDDAPSDCEVTGNNFFTRIDSKATIAVDHWIKDVIQGIHP